MFRLLPLLLALFALSASAQTVIDITSQDGSSVCSYPTGGVSTSSANPGHLAAQLTGTPTGTGCSTGTTNVPPTANFTYTTSGLTASFTDASTDSDGSVVSWSWNFGDNATSTLQNPSHTYAAAGTYSVTETVTDNGGASSTPVTQSVSVSSGSTGGSCPTIASSTAVVNGFSRLSGTVNISYGGLGNQNKDSTSFASVFGSAWPGDYNLAAIIPLPVANYMSLQFSVPSPYFSTAPSSLYGEYSVGETGYSAYVSMTISSNCGDFSTPGSAGSTVVAGCYKNMLGSTQFLSWKNTAGKCQLQDGKTYYLNIINADISNVTASGGTAASTKNGQCTSTNCSVPLANGPGNWSTYVP